MAPGLPSDEVAEDYKNALEDLVTNDRYQIANLTMIAKENIEHAEAISRVLTNHIKRAPPTRKLPALYVLDSLVKNIGSPYTVYFGRSLHETFMLAYSQVDNTVRKKLEEMLKTWREPVPGSLSTTSVFPVTSTQTIFEALNRFRGATAPVTQRNTPITSFRPPPRQVTQDYRNTPTPPQMTAGYSQYPLAASNESSTPQLPINYASYLPHSQPPVYPPSSTPQWSNSTPQLQSSYPAALVQRPPSRSAVDLPKLHADIDDLTTDAKIECATHPMDFAAQRKLSTLQTLKEILDSGTASEQDLLDIRNTVMQEMAKKLAQKHQASTQPVMPFLPSQLPYAPPASTSQSSYQQPAPAGVPSFINTTNLAELLRATANTQSTPQPQPAQPLIYPPPLQAYGTPPVIHATPAATNVSIAAPPPTIPASALPLLEQLRASGLLSATPTPPQGITPPVAFPPFLTQPAASGEVQFLTASIKLTRPQLVTSFLNARPNQCSTCGKRFTSDDIGREKKARHLDWHFKTKARMIEAEKRGLNRSWYVDEREWIASKEFEDDAGVDSEQNVTNGTSPAAKKKPQDFVRAPSDPVLRNAPCPIDQEPFRSEWSEEVQDFIWKDAVKVGNRYYHASCYREATRDRDKEAGGSTPLGAGFARTATPDSVLGKRKAEREMEETAKSRIKLEA